MAKKLKKTSTTSTVASQQEEHIWTLVRELGTPVDYLKGWAETANPVCVPKRILVYARNPQDHSLTRRPKEQHQHFTLNIALKGAGQICVDERIFRMDAGQAFLIFPFQFRYLTFLQENSIRWIAISFEMSHADFLESLRNQPWYLTPESTQILHHLLEAVSSRSSTRMTRAAEAQLLLAQFLHQSSAQGMTLSSSSLTTSAEAQKLLDRVHAYLYRHIDQPFKLENMARGIGCSQSYLRNKFKKHFQMSLGHYVARVRLNKAANLLRGNSLNISGVAQACGYSSLYAFSRTFHAAMGCSPQDYRIQIDKKMLGGRYSGA